MSWTAFALTYVVGLVFLVAPGYAFLAVARVPLWHRLLLAPLISTAWVAGLGIVFAWVHLRYDAWTVAGASVLVVVLLAALWRLTPLGRLLPGPTEKDAGRATPTAWGALAVGLLVSLGIWVVDFLRPLSGPAAITNGYDVPWHAAIIGEFIHSGDGSTLTSANVVPTVGSSFYPAAWHDMVALTAQAAHAPLFGALNAVVFGELTVVWPLAMVSFVTVLLGRRPVPVLAACVVGGLFAAFPLYFTAWGIIYSNLYGYCLLPALLALAVLLLQRGTDGLPRRTLVVLFVLGLGGTALAQPNAISTLVVLMTPMTLARLYRSRPSRAQGMTVSLLALLGLGVAWVGLAHTPALRRTTTLDRYTAGSLRHALEAVTLEGLGNTPDQYGLAVLAVAGALLLLFVVRRRRWLVVAHVLISLCYVSSAAQAVEVHLHWLRMNLTGYWYNDFVRLAGATVMTAVPLVVVAVDQVSERLRRVRLPRVLTAVAAVAVMSVLVAGVLTSTQFVQHRQRLEERSRPYSEITPAHLAFLRRVDAYVPAGAVVANNPGDGSTWAYPLFGLDVYFKAYRRNWIGRPSRQMRLLSGKLARAASDPAVCAAVRAAHVGYLLRMSGDFRFMSAPWNGQRVTARTPGFRRVLHGPGAALYKITACGSDHTNSETTKATSTTAVTASSIHAHSRRTVSSPVPAKPAFRTPATSCSSTTSTYDGPRLLLRDPRMFSRRLRPSAEET